MKTGLMALLILVAGCFVGWMIVVVTEQILRVGESKNKAWVEAEEKPEHKKIADKPGRTRWQFFVPPVSGGLSLVGWLQLSYQHLPFYVFALNVLLIWLFVLIALVDALTHLIFPRMLGAGVAITASIWGIASWLNGPVGVVYNEATGSFRSVNAHDLPLQSTSELFFKQVWPVSFYDSLAGLTLSIVIFGSLYGLGRFVTHQEVFGRGDVLLAALVGLTVGWERVWFAISLSIVLSLIAAGLLLGLQKKAHSRTTFIAYGPFLCAGAIGALIFQL